VQSNFRARIYDPVHGRFLSRDPMGYLDSMNLYSFVNNNPINYTDPLGTALISDNFLSKGSNYLHPLFEDPLDLLLEVPENIAGEFLTDREDREMLAVQIQQEIYKIGNELSVPDYLLSSLQSGSGIYGAQSKAGWLWGLGGETDASGGKYPPYGDELNGGSLSPLGARGGIEKDWGTLALVGEAWVMKGEWHGTWGNKDWALISDGGYELVTANADAGVRDYSLTVGAEASLYTLHGSGGANILSLPVQIEVSLRVGVAARASIGKKTQIQVPLVGVALKFGR